MSRTRSLNDIPMTSKDRGWSWVVCLATFVVHVILGGLMYSFGILFVEIMDHFQSSKAATAWIFSILQGIANFGGPINAMLINRFGCRRMSITGALLLLIGYVISPWSPNVYFMYFSLGILGGVGNGFVYLSSLVALSQHFDQKRALATGIAVSGVGVGTFGFGPLTRWLIDTYTWKGALLLQAGITFHCIACGLVYPTGRDKNNAEALCETMQDVDELDKDCKRDKNIECDQPLLETEKETLTNGKDTKLTLQHEAIEETQPKQRNQLILTVKPLISRKVKEMQKMMMMLQSTPFVAMLLSIVLNYLGHVIPFMYIVDSARQYGIGFDRSVWFVSTIGIGNTLGRFAYGVLGNFHWVNKGCLYSTSLICVGIMTPFVPIVTSFEMLICYCALYGFILGGVLTLCLVLLVDIVGTDQSSDALGFYCLACGIALFLGPPTAGWLFDVSHTYTATFLFSGITVGSAGILTAFVSDCCRKH